MADFGSLAPDEGPMQMPAAADPHADLLRQLLRASTAAGPVRDNDPIRNAVAPLASYAQSQRDKGMLGRLADTFGPRRDEQGNPQAPGVGDFLNAAMWVLPGGPRGGTIRPSPFGASNLSAANRNSLRPERPAVPERTPNIAIAETNPYAVSMRDIEAARGNSAMLRHMETAVDNWASQSGREATLPVRAALNKEIERAQAMELADIEKQWNIDQSKIVPFPER